MLLGPSIPDSWEQWVLRTFPALGTGASTRKSWGYPKGASQLQREVVDLAPKSRRAKAASYSTFRSLTDGRKAAWHSFRMVQFRGRGASVWFMTLCKFHGHTRNCNPEQCLEEKPSPTAVASHGHVHTCKFHQGRGFLELGRQVKRRRLSHRTFLRKLPSLCLQPCSCIPNVAEWRHPASCFGEGMHGVAGEGQPAWSSQGLESKLPAPNARSLSRSPPSKRQVRLWGGKPGPFAQFAWIGAGAARKKAEGTSIKPQQGTSTFLHKASLRGWKLAQGEGLGQRERMTPKW